MEYSFVAKLLLDKSAFDDGIDEASKKSKGIGTAIAKAAKVGAVALAGAATAAGALVKSAVDSYADYEQLVGGVETLFGESAQKVLADANNAFKTAGMSVNEYMETSIESAAALINSLGGDQEKAAELMNLSITDMADNVNKMGTSMEAVQNAYRGFSRGNFTMLDNLALGFAGTKEGMQELLDKAEELSGVKFDISSYSDIVQAIHVVQKEMRISGLTAEEAAEAVRSGAMTEQEAFEAMGTTAKEASSTISGSLSAMKSAWTNLITGIADENADFDQLINNFVESATTAFENLIPWIGTALNGIGALIEGLAPVISNAIPTLVQNTLPYLASAAVSMVVSFVEVLGNEDSIDMIVQSAVDIVLILANALVENVDKVIDAVVKIIVTIAEALTDPENLEKIIEAAIKIVIAICKGLLEALPDLGKALLKVLENIRYTIGEWKHELFETGKKIVKNIADGIADAVRGAVSWGHDLVDNFVQGMKDRVQKVIDAAKELAQKVKDFLGFSEPKKGPLSNFHTYAPDMMKLFAKGIADNEHLITDQISKSFDFDVQMLGTPPTGNSRSAGGITINVYGTEGQSVTELAREVERRIAQNVRIKEAAWA